MKSRLCSRRKGTPPNPAFDIAAAHKYFAAHCFNAAWDLIEKTERTSEEDRTMVALNQASRIQAILGNATDARNYAEVCRVYSFGKNPFLLGYAYEAMARAAKVAGNPAEAAKQLALAKEQAVLVTEKEDRELLQNDLASLE
jgi:hypothetical protein